MNRSGHTLFPPPCLLGKTHRAAIKGQRPFVLWLTGLSGAGKSTIAGRVERYLWMQGCHTYLLDGDSLRCGINGDLSFSYSDRVENIRRVAEVARLMVDAGLIVVVAVISPFRRSRQFARSLFAPSEFVEVYVNTSLEIAEARDAKGLYRKARMGSLAGFTGVDSVYEAPLNPEIMIDTSMTNPDSAAACIVEWLRCYGHWRTDT